MVLLPSTPRKKAALAGNARSNVGPSPRNRPETPPSAIVWRKHAVNDEDVPPDW